MNLINAATTLFVVCSMAGPHMTYSKRINGPGSYDLKPRRLKLDYKCPEHKIVECTNGFVTSGKISCQDACDGRCCVDPTDPNGDPCDGFNGIVCKDGASCMGKGACTEANIGEVYKGCTEEESCKWIGKYGPGSVEKIVKSCQGIRSCMGAAHVNKLER